MASPEQHPALHGILPVLATPFVGSGADPQGLHVAEDDMVRIVDFALAAGAHGIVYPGVASEFNFLSEAERRQLSLAVCQRVAGRVPIVVGASAPNVEEVRRLLNHGKDIGARAAMVMAPASLGSDAETLVDFFRQVSQATDLPIILQNAPPPVGAGLSVETILAVAAAVESVHYVKEETLPSGQRITQLLDVTGDSLVGVMGGGGARYVVDELNRGACGAMPACELTDLHVALYQAHRAGDLRQARLLYDRTLPLLLFQAVFRMRMTKEVLVRRGIIRSPAVRAPLPTLDDQDQTELQTMLSQVEDLLTVREP